jgi:hypothetical protein
LLRTTTREGGRQGRRIRRTLAAAILAAGALLLLPAAHAQAATRTADPSTLSSVYSAAQPGDTIELAGGSYTFSGGVKPAPAITIRPQAGASPAMRLDFHPAQNLIIEGVTVTDAVFRDSGTRDIVLRNSNVVGQVTLRTSELANANILLSHNTHNNWDKNGGDAEGRVWLPGKTSQPSGITIRNSEFAGGLSDGIQNGSRGTRIIGNVFHHLETGTADGVHADAIQLYGSSQTLIAGNWFHDLPNAVGIIMAADGADHEVIEDNLFGPNNRRPYTDLFSDNGSVLRHNTWVDGACEYNVRCGVLSVSFKEADGPGTGTVIQDNILNEICCANGSTFTSQNNLLGRQSPRGPGDIGAMPIFQGGAAATTWQGFRLAANSPGKGNASDGLDRGVRFDLVGTPGPSGSAAPVPSQAPPAQKKAKKKGDRRARAIWKAPRNVRVGKRVTLNAKRSRGNGKLRCRWAFVNRSGRVVFDRARGCKLRKRFSSSGRKWVRLTVRDKDGDVDSLTRSFRVRR